MSVLLAFTPVHYVCAVPMVAREKALDSLQLELKMTVSCEVGAGN